MIIKKTADGKILSFQNISQIPDHLVDLETLNDEVEINKIEINKLKDEKELELKANRDKLLNDSKFFVISAENEDYSFALNNRDLPQIAARISRMPNDSMTLGWNTSNNKRVQLNRVAFKRLQNHIDDNDENVWTLFSEKLEELVDLTTIEQIQNFNTNLIS